MAIASAAHAGTGRGVPPAGMEVGLSSKEFQLLATLAADPERVFTKRELLQTVWDFRSPGRTRTLDSHATRLRQKLAAFSDATWIVNVWGVGLPAQPPRMMGQPTRALERSIPGRLDRERMSRRVPIGRLTGGLASPLDAPWAHRISSTINDGAWQVILALAGWAVPRRAARRRAHLDKGSGIRRANCRAACEIAGRLLLGLGRGLGSHAC
jgi:hypothetical protein